MNKEEALCRYDHAITVIEAMGNYLESNAFTENPEGYLDDATEAINALRRIEATVPKREERGAKPRKPMSSVMEAFERKLHRVMGRPHPDLIKEIKALRKVIAPIEQALTCFRDIDNRMQKGKKILREMKAMKKEDSDVGE